MQYQKEYYVLEQKAKKSKAILSHLSQEKELAINERNHLKSEYDHLQVIIQSRMEEISLLRA